MNILHFFLYSLGVLALFWSYILSHYHWDARARTRRIEAEIQASRRRVALHLASLPPARAPVPSTRGPAPNRRR